MNSHVFTPKRIILGLAFVLIIIIIVVNIVSRSRNTLPSGVNPTITPRSAETPTPVVNLSKPTSPFTFIDPSVTPTTLNEDIAIQLKADYEYAHEAESIERAFPWLTDLPLDEEEYFVYFNFNENRFVARIYDPEKESGLQAEIYSRLKIMDIPVDDYQIEWRTE